MNSTFPDQKHIRELWQRGMCPCCGMPGIFGWTGNDGEEFEPAPIAEDVMICGRCVGNKHCDPDRPDGKATLEYILEAIANG